MQENEGRDGFIVHEGHRIFRSMWYLTGLVCAVSYDVL
jgi:hypothetical protein